MLAAAAGDQIMSHVMSDKRLLLAAAIAALAGGLPARVNAQQTSQSAAAAVEIDDHAVGGVVTSRFGPEAGVWVIAETSELGTRFAKMVVTDDLGRYVLPDLPKANYNIWVRGYGLVDSPKVAAEPGKPLNLTAVVAPNLAAAAQYYPAIYWFAMIRIPDRSKFPGTGPNGNGIPVNFKTRDQWLNSIKTNGCGNCHQIGNYATRTIPEALGHFDTSMEAWARRLQSGPAGLGMIGTMAGLLTPEGGHLAALAVLDRSHQGRRAAERNAAAADRRGAQRRGHGAGLVGPQALPARPRAHRQTPADRQRLWVDLWGS
jgi:hypothetical protein